MFKLSILLQEGREGVREQRLPAAVRASPLRRQRPRRQPGLARRQRDDNLLLLRLARRDHSGGIQPLRFPRHRFLARRQPRALPRLLLSGRAHSHQGLAGQGDGQDESGGEAMITTSVTDELWDRFYSPVDVDDILHKYNYTRLLLLLLLRTSSVCTTFSPPRMAVCQR